jgi:hypothetical protein
MPHWPYVCWGRQAGAGSILAMLASAMDSHGITVQNNSCIDWK